jgi:uncharacterized membrane protein (UPF0127 family)
MKFTIFEGLHNSEVLKALIGVAAAVLICATCTEARSPIAVIGKNKIQLEVAQSEQEITRGLMFRTSMPEDAGMVFLFDPPRPVNFWMYHTLIPLDMMFIKNNKIVKIFEQVPPCKSENPRECPRYPDGEGIEVTEVLEVNGGYVQKYGIKEGDRIYFTIKSNPGSDPNPAPPAAPQ